jgi:ribosome-binding protein aMBF1 (putative translation factor)
MAGNGDATVVAIDAGERTELPASVMRLATAIRRAREKRGWSQAVLAEAAHVSHDIVHRLEAGKGDVLFGVAVDIARVLNVSLDDAAYTARVGKRVREAAEQSEQQEGQQHDDP